MAEAFLGRSLWYELPTTDMKAAEAFYTTVVGWTTMATQGAHGPYTIFKNAEGNQVAGVMTRPSGLTMPPHWVMYIGVPRLEDAVSQIEQRGGSAMSPIVDIVRRARCSHCIRSRRKRFCRTGHGAVLVAGREARLNA